MHKEKTRLLLKHVTVDGRGLNAALAQYFDHIVDFAGQQYKVSGNRGLASASRLEIQCRRQAHGWWNRHAALGDVLCPRHAHLEYATVYLAFVAKRLLNCRSVNLDAWL